MWIINIKGIDKEEDRKQRFIKKIKKPPNKQKINKFFDDNHGTFLHQVKTLEMMMKQMVVPSKAATRKVSLEDMKKTSFTDVYKQGYYKERVKERQI